MLNSSTIKDKNFLEKNWRRKMNIKIRRNKFPYDEVIVFLT